MRIKEILPWSIESPIIHLVQPSPSIPLGHEVVFQQTSTNGAGDNAIYALAAQEKVEPRKYRKVREERQKVFKDKKETNLNCGYISPSIHQTPGVKKKRNSFYDLRHNYRSMSIPVAQKQSSKSPPLSIRSKSLEESPTRELRKPCPDFEEILRQLGCESRLSSDTGESGSETSRRRSSYKRNIERQESTSTACSSDSVFYEIALNDPEVERSSASSQVAVTPRKSFSEETFDKNKTILLKQRSKMLEHVRNKSRTASSDSCDEVYEEIWGKLNPHDKRRVSQMVDDLLLEIYGDKSTRPVRRRSCTGIMRERPPVLEDTHYDSFYEDNAYYTENTSGSESFRLCYLQERGVEELREMCQTLQADVKRLGNRLVKQLIRRDCFQAKRDWHCDWVTAYLQAHSEKRSEDTKTRFSVAPSPGDSGFTQWQNGMRMVARLPEGIPSQFRKTLWLNLAEKHLASRGVEWELVEEFCFNEFTNPDDEELGVQIVKDVHRTGCSLFCGVSGKDNQALLKRVLLAYARWNKAVGYCQGFNMLAALILQVMDKSEVDSVKVMIYLIEGVLPESYFANNLRGLSVDMAVFRDLLRIKLPTLSRHFDQLQCDSKDSGTSYEPPLTNVFTMQWFLTLFCNCLPQDTVLRVWDLIFLEGNHMLLCTALAIWSTLSDRILSVESADEFYCIMGVLTREMLEFGLMDANALIKAIVSFNLPELAELREKYLYNITPWTQSVSTVARRGLRLFYSDDDTDTEEDDEKIAIATAYGLFRSPKKKDGPSGVTSPPRALTCPDKEKIAMDISALTKQYRKLRERQKQAHVILTAACGSQNLVGPTTSPAMNHLLMGKFALVNSKGRRLGPPPGSIPPPSQPRTNPSEKNKITISGETLHWKDTVDSKRQQKDSDDDKSPGSSPSKNSSRRGSSSSSTSTELCDDPQRLSDSEDQTNSLSECYIPPDNPEPTTSLRTAQPKVQHPVDIDSCKEEIEEAFEEKKPESSTDQHGENKIQLKEDTLSVSPDREENGSQQKRKASFRIDPEELRQLDRKLSLKIVEIERRKSSAGIESEDLNSKVLFPFDRDYIQDVEKADRDTPTSIPDDRMCSTDEFVCSFEEETILIPDLITTHKPPIYKMTSVEECDETRFNESTDDSQEVLKGSFDDNDDDLKFYGDTESSEGNDENEESQDSLIDTKFNFDELFNKKTYSENNLDDTYEEPVSVCINSTLEVENPLQKCSSSEIFSDASSSENIQLIRTDIFLDSKPSVSSNNLNSKIQNILEKQFNTQSDCTGLSDDMKVDMTVAEKEILERCENLKTSNNNEEISVLTSEGCSQNLSDSQKALERRLANLLPSLPVSLDSSLPDITTVTSRDIEIKSIREKYANIAPTSVDDSSINVEPESNGICPLPKSLLLNYNFSSDKPDTTPLKVEVNERILEQSESSMKLNSKEDLNLNDENTVLAQTKVIKNTVYIESDQIPGTAITQQSTGDDQDFSKLCDAENTEKTNVQSRECNENNILKGREDYKFEDTIGRPSSSSTNRRGSEVALSLILKENSQILSKIHHQSRRSSEICIADSTSLLENSSKDYTDTFKLSLVTDVGVEIQSLNKTILENLGDKITNFELNETQCNTEDELSLNNSCDISKECNSDKVPEGMIYADLDSFLKEEGGLGSGLESKELSKIVIQSENQSLINEEMLPDVCKFDGDLNKSPNHGNYSQSSKLTDSEKYISKTSLNLCDSQSGVSSTDVDFQNIKDSYTFATRVSITSPTKEIEENYFIDTKRVIKLKDLLSVTKLSASPEECVEKLSPISQRSNYDYKKRISSGDSFAEKKPDTNDDILKELRSLDIKPEEILDYTDPKRIPLSPLSPEDNFYTYKSKIASKETSESPAHLEDGLYSAHKFKQTSFDHSSDLRSSRSIFQNIYKDHKAASLDTALLDSVVSGKSSDEKHKSLARSDTALEDDNSLYINSYKSHGRLLIEKGELDTCRNLDGDTLNTSEICGGVRKPLDKFEESAYDLKNTGRANLNTPYSEFLSRDSRLLKHTDIENKEKHLFKYKSEDHGRSVSPSRYRFSSASPVRKRLDTLSADPLYSALNRAKSPSPTGYTSRSHTYKEHSSYSQTEHSGSDVFGCAKDYKRYPRAESLDLNTGSDRSMYLRKKAESFETSSSDRVLEEKKVTSPSSPVKFNPFPIRSSSRQPKELGVKLGLYLPPKSDKSPSKRLT